MWPAVLDFWQALGGLQAMLGAGGDAECLFGEQHSVLPVLSFRWISPSLSPCHITVASAHLILSFLSVPDLVHWQLLPVNREKVKLGRERQESLGKAGCSCKWEAEEAAGFGGKKG